MIDLKTSILQITAVLSWLDGEAKEQRLIQDSINVEHPNFKGSEVEVCWKMYEHNLLHIELARKYLRGMLAEHELSQAKAKNND